MTRRLTTALTGLALLTFVVVWAVVYYGFIYIGGRGFEMIEMVQKPVHVPLGDAERIHVAVHMVYGDLLCCRDADNVRATERLHAGLSLLAPALSNVCTPERLADAAQEVDHVVGSAAERAA